MNNKIQDGYQQIKNGINSADPFFAGRSGATEAQLCMNGLHDIDHLFDGGIDPRFILQITHAAGIYPYTKESFLKFIDSYRESCYKMQIVGSWLGGLENILMNPEAIKIPLQSLDVIDKDPWTRNLDGKKVVVIHPFSESIKYQYQRKKEWDTHKWCPQFKSLMLIPSRFNHEIQDIGYHSWQEEIERIKAELYFDYDVALIGCGAIGAILGAHVFDSGKKAIHMGGCLQLMFGIRGTRWENMPEYLELMNDAWIRPFDSDKPKKFPTYYACDKNCYF